MERALRGDVRRAADYFKLIRYSFSGGAKSFGGKVCDIRRFFHLIWECSRRLAEVIVENKDCVDLIRQYDREDAFFYCDPPYFEAEGCYAVEFPKEDHQRLHDALLECKGHALLYAHLSVGLKSPGKDGVYLPQRPCRCGRQMLASYQYHCRRSEALALHGKAGTG